VKPNEANEAKRLIPGRISTSPAVAQPETCCIADVQSAAQEVVERFTPRGLQIRDTADRKSALQEQCVDARHIPVRQTSNLTLPAVRRMLMA